MEIIIGKSKTTGNPIPFGTNEHAVQVIIGGAKTTLGVYISNIRTEINGLIAKLNAISDPEVPVGEIHSLEELNGRLTALEDVINLGETTDVNTIIDRFNEIVDFLNGISETDTLSGLISSITTSINTLKTNLENRMDSRYIDVSTINMGQVYNRFYRTKYNIYVDSLNPVEQRSISRNGPVYKHDYSEKWSKYAYVNSGYCLVCKLGFNEYNDWKANNLRPAFNIRGDVTVGIAVITNDDVEDANNGNINLLSADGNTITKSFVLTPSTSTNFFEWRISYPQDDTENYAKGNAIITAIDAAIATASSSPKAFNIYIVAINNTHNNILGLADTGSIYARVREEIVFGRITDSHPDNLFRFYYNQYLEDEDGNGGLFEKIEDTTWSLASQDIKNLWVDGNYSYSSVSNIISVTFDS
ncbi:MAG: hypothetical protein IJG68_01995 [Bacilli bacterium]|nr:hypothetical protein [Bacilli bacterium]